MGSMFGGWGGFGYLGEVVAGTPGPASGPTGGGFPGIFPGAGVSNSGWAGFGQFNALQPPCTPENIQQGKCVMGPSMAWMGKR